MSMISEQINKLREAVKSYRPYVPYYVIGLLHNAADTIEALSAKQENAYYVKRNGKYDVIVSIMYNKADNKYHFVNLSKNHICACGFETTEEAIADMEQRKNNGSICDFYLIERPAEDCGGGWIPCDEDNLPDKEVLCCDQRGEMILGYVSEDKTSDTGFCAENDNVYMYNCVKWMEKPKP